MSEVEFANKKGGAAIGLEILIWTEFPAEKQYIVMNGMEKLEKNLIKFCTIDIDGIYLNF